MYGYLIHAGIPTGPLSLPRDAWRKGRGKYHLSSSCNDEATRVSITPIDVPTDNVCSRCSGDHDEITATFIRWLARVEDQIRLAKDALEGRHRYLGGAEGTRLTLLVWLWEFENPGPDRELEQFPEVATYEKSTVVPLIAQALEAVNAEIGSELPDDWPIRHGAYNVVTDGYGPAVIDPKNYPALCPQTTGPRYRHTDISQDDLAKDVCRGIRDQLLSGIEPSQAWREPAAAAEARVREMGSPKTRSQYPMDAPVPDGTYATLGEAADATWVAVACAQVREMARSVSTQIADIIDRVHSEPVTATLWSRPGYLHRDLGMAMLAHYGQAASPASEILVIAPASITNFITASFETRNGAHAPPRKKYSWGPVEPDDTPEVFHTARQLRESVEGDDVVVAALARAALI